MREDESIERCRREIAEIERLLRAGHPDIAGLCLGLADWSGELRLLERADYTRFISGRSQLESEDGFAPVWLPTCLFPLQSFAVEWSLLLARAGLFFDCGLGKTLIQLVWAENVVRKTNGRVLILTPLAVAHQTVQEGEKFGIEVRRTHELGGAGIYVSNYERLHYFSPADFVGCVCDESAILKSFSGVTRNAITEFMRKLRYRLLCTATPAPNDYIELGTSSEALGYLGYMDMLNRFFKNDLNNSAMGRVHGKVIQWRFKGHAEDPYWRYVCSWARVARRPSDLGFDDGPFLLTDLIEQDHLIEAQSPADGYLFDLPANGLREQRDERRRTIQERCEKVAELVRDHDYSLVWCDLNPEGDMLERLLPSCEQVSGNDPDEAKEEKLIGFARGEFRRLVTKPKIGAWGLNYQHCAHLTFFPSHSFEQRYQGIRRCWRFGQTRPVVVDTVMSEGARTVMENQKRKAVQAEQMFEQIVQRMNQQLRIDGARPFPDPEQVPQWL